MKRVKVDQGWKEGYVTSLEPLTVTVSLDDPTEIPCLGSWGDLKVWEVREKKEKKGQADETKTASASEAETANPVHDEESGTL